MPKPLQLVVEGYEDLNTVAHLMGHYIEWPDDPKLAPVQIRIGKSVNEILNKEYLETLLKQSGLSTLAIMLDADESPSGRWQALRDLLIDRFPDIPSVPVGSGFITTGEEDIKLGIWIMPDNKSAGMLETFLHYLVPEAKYDLWSHAKESTIRAKEFGASYRDVHFDKAAIHAYLAWQDPPGDRFGIALTKKALEPRSPAAHPFVDWFCELFQLQLTAA